MAFRGASFKYKIRKIGKSKTSGDISGITIPRCIAEDKNFSGATLGITTSGTNLILLEVID